MLDTAIETSWLERNQRYLGAQFARLKSRLRGEASAAEGSQPEDEFEPPPAIDRLTKLFGLSAFERDVVLLCAGVEMDSEVAALCGAARGSRQPASATFGLALSVLAEPHWSALAPGCPLRRFQLVNVEAGHGLTSAPLRIDERVLHYLAGTNALDARLETLVRANPYPQWITEAHADIAAEVLWILRGCPGTPPLIHFCGDDAQGQQDVAALAMHNAGLQLFTLRAEDLAAAGSDLDQFHLLWQRESLLLNAALLIQSAPEAVSASARHLAERLPGIVFLASREPVNLSRAFLRFDVQKPAPSERQHLWQMALGAAAQMCNGMVSDLAEQFRLSARTIFATGTLASQADGPVQARELWNVCRTFSRPQLEDLAQRLVPSAGWDDLVLPDAQMRILRQLASQVRHRMKVYETWGFAAKGRRGQGVSALFAGESGVGKTLAAEVLARDLDLDLYRVDVASVVSKYIGETSKNMRQVFDAAEEGGVLLLFDEADALFGKRSEVKDSHDRYANIDVSYLLQRMETYQGLSILTTNMRTAVDRAFQRRLRFIVNFPFPDAAQREAIWRRVFPRQTPTGELDAKKLAQLNVAGGNIRNIALNAAFLAAESGTAVTMAHVLSAARLEAEKIDRPLSEAEIRGWV
jgi:hypothetical protein